MAENGASLTDLVSVPLLSRVFGEVESAPGVREEAPQEIHDLGAQLVSEGPIADEITAIKASIVTGVRWYATWATVSAETIGAAGLYFAVSSTDTGTHTGYAGDAPSVTTAGLKNSGYYKSIENPGGAGFVLTRVGENDSVSTETAARIAGDAALQAQIDASAGQISRGLLTSGELVGGSRFAYEAAAFGGASSDSTTRTLSVPAGSSGNSSYSAGKAVVSADFPRLPVGTVIELETRWTISAGFTTDKPFNATFFGRLTLASGTINLSTATVPGSSRLATLVASEVLASTTLRRRVRYTVVGDEISLGAGFLIAGADTADGAASAQVQSVTWSIYSLPAAAGQATVSDVMLDVREEGRLAGYGVPGIPALHFGVGSVYAASTPAPQANGNGATLLAGPDGRNSGVTIAAGASGLNALCQTKWPYVGSGNTGKRLKIVHVLDLSATFTRAFGLDTLQVSLAAGGTVNATTGNGRLASAMTVSTVGTKRYVTWTYIVQGDEAGLWPYSVLAAASATAVEETIVASDLAVEVVANTGSTYTAMDENLRMALTATKVDILGMLLNPGQYARTLVVAPGGTYPTPKAANDAITDASASKRYRILVTPGLYLDPADWEPKNWVYVIGVDRWSCISHFENADNASAADISAKSTIYLRWNCGIENMTISCRNARYAAHLETSNVTKDTTQRIVNCYIVHRGNYSAVNNTWAVSSQLAVGAGTSSGQKIYAQGSVFEGPGGGFSYHTNGYSLYGVPIGTVVGTVVDFEGCTFVGTDSSVNVALRVLPMGSRVQESLRLVGCTFVGGDLQYANGSNIGAPWTMTALVDQPAMHNEIAVWGYGNTGLVFRNQLIGRALRIDSNTTGGASSLAVAGDLWPVLLGDGTSLKYARSRPVGSAGLPAQLIGWGDIQEASPALCKLSARLGDRSATPITGTITVDGGAPQTVTLGGNYTGMTNAAIIVLIQAQITGATVTSYLVDSEYQGFFSDEEASPRNDTGTGILAGTALAWSTAKGRNIRPMAAADSARLFAGFAMEDIPTGRTGRVKRAGATLVSRILRSDAAAIALGDGLSISTDGRVEKSATKPVAYAIRSDAVELAA